MECNGYTRLCYQLNGGVRYREYPLREAILYMYIKEGGSKISLLESVWRQSLGPRHYQNFETLQSVTVEHQY